MITARFAVAQSPTPVFNTPHLSDCFGGTSGDSLALDPQDLLRAVETVLFPKTKIELLDQMSPYIWKMRTEEYRYEGSYYIDTRFVQFSQAVPPVREIKLPPPSVILSRLESQLGSRYIWGGNWPEGIDLLPRLYPSRSDLKQLPALHRETWQLKGVDCTGLLYYATDGWTKRNSLNLASFGIPIAIEKLSFKEILNVLEPLDLIAWKGHVVCIFDKNTAIESKHPEGVIKQSLSKRLSEIMNERKPVNDYSQDPCFVVRRWHPSTF